METQYGGKRLGLYRLGKSGRNVIVHDDINYVGNILHQVDTGATLPENKTIGMLMPTTEDRPNEQVFNFEQTKNLSVRGPTLFGVSGWSHSQEGHSQVVHSTKWAWIALKFVAPCVSHDFNRSWNDNAAQQVSLEFNGREAASHVEVSLSTAYAFSLTQAFVPRVEGESEASYLHKQLCGLSRIRDTIPKERRDVALYIDKDPCGSCRDYVYKLQQLTGLRIRLVATCVKATRKKKNPDPGFSMEEARRQVENMSSKGYASMAGYRDWNKAKWNEKSSKNAERKWLGSKSYAIRRQGFSDSYFEIANRDGADLIASTPKDFGSESDATICEDDWDSDFTMRDETDDDMDAVALRTPRYNPYRNPYPEPVYHSPTEEYFY